VLIFPAELFRIILEVRLVSLPARPKFWIIFLYANIHSCENSVSVLYAFMHQCTSLKAPAMRRGLPVESDCKSQHLSQSI